MRTIKITDRTRKASIKNIDDSVSNLMNRKNDLEEQKEEVLKEYKEQFKNMFIGKKFCQRHKSRDSSVIKYITVLEVGDPYLITNSTVVTCSIKCYSVEMRTSKWNNDVQTTISYTNVEWLYAHTTMTEVSEQQYMKDLNKWKAMIK